MVYEELVKIQSQLLTSIVSALVTASIPILVVRYLSLREKNKYIRLLRIHFPYIEKFLHHIKNYKMPATWLAFAGFYLGTVASIKILIGSVSVFETIINTSLSYIFGLNFFKKFIPVILDIGELNLVMLFYSCYNIFILISFIILAFWVHFVVSKNLSKPQLMSNGSLKASSISVYFSYWSFLGILFGINAFIYALLYTNLNLYSIMAKDFSLNWVSFSNLCTSLEANVRYLRVHKFLYTLGLVASCFYIAILYYEITSFSKNAINTITDFYKYDFPYVKIRTESGEVKGQLRDIRNKSLVTLSENNELKIVPWDKIQIMEASNPNKDGQFIFNNGSIK